MSASKFVFHSDVDCPFELFDLIGITLSLTPLPAWSSSDFLSESRIFERLLRRSRIMRCARGELFKLFCLLKNPDPDPDPDFLIASLTFASTEGILWCGESLADSLSETLGLSLEGDREFDEANARERATLVLDLTDTEDLKECAEPCEFFIDDSLFG